MVRASLDDIKYFIPVVLGYGGIEFLCVLPYRYLLILLVYCQRNGYPNNR
jgi:hypothetical protein